ncbi:MAG: histidine--tRNA ligase [Gammaproteobacteria bacterium]|nr:histidine--tRNA ligase [Gammaproteobacteria bacterium]
MDKIHSLTGMIDLISSKTDKSDFANKIFYTEKVLKKIFNSFSFNEIRTPAIENTNLFTRSVGNTSDIVNKELYSFFDKNEKSITLRPEGTASVIRALIEKKIDSEFHKLWYLGPMWRYERPQKGRYRQFNQAGVEILGYEEGIAEFELISMIIAINKKLKIDNSIIKINHLGNIETKILFCEELVKYLKPYSSKLDEKDYTRLNNNPLRILDSKNEVTLNLLKDGPKIEEYLPENSINMLETIKAMFSEECDIKIDHNLVRGLDYYTGFVFEAISSNLGAQDSYLGGGRYDNLCNQLGGKKLPAVGMAIGIERLAMLSNQCEEEEILISLFILSDNIKSKAYKIAHQIRSLNDKVVIDVHLNEGSLKSKLRRANKDNAEYAIIIGEEEFKSDKFTLKSLKGNSPEQETLCMKDLVEYLSNL